jgi:hypothetical protein
MHIRVPDSLSTGTPDRHYHGTAYIAYRDCTGFYGLHRWYTVLLFMTTEIHTNAQGPMSALDQTHKKKHNNHLYDAPPSPARRLLLDFDTGYWPRSRSVWTCLMQCLGLPSGVSVSILHCTRAKLRTPRCYGGPQPAWWLSIQGPSSKHGYPGKRTLTRATPCILHHFHASWSSRSFVHAMPGAKNGLANAMPIF